MPDVILRSPFNGETISVPSTDPYLPVLLRAGFVREDPPTPPTKEKRSR